MPVLGCVMTPYKTGAKMVYLFLKFTVGQGGIMACSPAQVSFGRDVERGGGLQDP